MRRKTTGSSTIMVKEWKYDIIIDPASVSTLGKSKE
jgi:hypothetical protein